MGMFRVSMTEKNIGYHNVLDNVDKIAVETKIFFYFIHVCVIGANMSTVY